MSDARDAVGEISFSLDYLVQASFLGLGISPMPKLLPDGLQGFSSGLLCPHSLLDPTSPQQHNLRFGSNHSTCESVPTALLSAKRANNKTEGQEKKEKDDPRVEWTP